MTANEIEEQRLNRKKAASTLALRVLTESETRDVAAGRAFVKVGPLTPVSSNVE